MSPKRFTASFWRRRPLEGDRDQASKFGVGDGVALVAHLLLRRLDRLRAHDGETGARFAKELNGLVCWVVSADT
jgi:hypothetical protein